MCPSRLFSGHRKLWEVCQLLDRGCVEQDSEAVSGLSGKGWRSPSKPAPGTSQRGTRPMAPTPALENACSESQGFPPPHHHPVWMCRFHWAEDEGHCSDGREQEGGPNPQMSPPLTDLFPCQPPGKAECGPRMLWSWDKSRWAGMGITSYSRSPGSQEVRPGCNLQLLTRTHPWQTHSNHSCIHLASMKVSSLTVISIPICKLETVKSRSKRYGEQNALISLVQTKAYPAAEKHQLPLQRSETPATCSQHVASTCGLFSAPTLS